MEETKEKYLETSPIPVSIKGTETIISQMKNGICKIYTKNGAKGTGFFCKISNQTKTNYLNVLFTNNHVLNENDIRIGSIIDFSLNDDNIYKQIKIDEKRKVFTDEETDTTFIEIRPNEDGVNFFLDLDDSVFKETEFLEKYYKNASVYILQYPKGQNVMVAYGNINQIQDKKNICHTCYTEEGSSGSPILSLNNYKFIGIHYGSSHFNFNKGTLIKHPINKYFETNKSNKSISIIQKSKEEIKIPILQLNEGIIKIKQYISPNIYFSEFLQNKDESIYKYNKSFYSNEDFVALLYKEDNYNPLIKYLRDKTIEKGIYSEKDIKSWIWCLYKSLKSQSDVSNGKILYSCLKSKFSEELKVGNKFIFGYFLSTTVNIEAKTI